MSSIYTCESCGVPTTGAAACDACLSALEAATRPPRKRSDSERVRREAYDLASRIRERLREHLSQRPPCEHCRTNPSLMHDLLDAEQASAEILTSIAVLAELVRDRRFEVDPSLLEMMADTARRFHAALECLVLRLGGPAILVDALGALQTGSART